MVDYLSNLWNRLQSGSQLRLSAVDRDALKQHYPERAAEIDAFFETLEQAADQSAAEVATAAMPGMDSSNDATLPPRQQPAVPAAVDEDAVTLLPVHSSDPADEFATVIPINQDNDATLAPARKQRCQERMALSKFGLRATRSIGVPGIIVSSGRQSWY